VVMMLNLGSEAAQRERSGLAPRNWIGPAVLAGILLGELVLVLPYGAETPAFVEIDPKQVGVALFGPYLLGVELASFLLLAGLVGAYHLGRRRPRHDRKGE